MSGSTVPLGRFLHLKSGLAYLEENNLLVAGEFIDHPAFKKYNQIVVAGEEMLAANSIWVNGKVLMPNGLPKTKEKIEKAGYPVIPLEISEFQKLDGGLSCLSLRF